MFLVYLFSIQLGWFPADRLQPDHRPEGIVDNLKSMALPVSALVAGLTAVYTRLLRSDLIATLQEDFVLMARCKGLPTWHILLRHALRPSSFSLLTVFGINFGTLIGGSVIVETFFVIPGVGELAVRSILQREYLVVQGVVLMIATAFVRGERDHRPPLLRARPARPKGRCLMSDVIATVGSTDIATPGALASRRDRRPAPQAGRGARASPGG